MKPKLFKYMVTLPDSKKIMVKANSCEVRHINNHLWFLKDDAVIYVFKEWLFFKKL